MSRKIIGPVARGNSGVPAYVVVFRRPKCLTFFLLNIEGLEPKIVVFVGTAWRRGRADGSSKIANLSPIGGYTGGFWEVNFVKRGIIIIRMGVVSSVIG